MNKKSEIVANPSKQAAKPQPPKVQRELKDLPHASAATLDKLEALLGALRTLKGMRETSRGRFYRRGRTFLHFHEHERDLFADVRWTGTGWQFERVRVTTSAERKALLARIEASLVKPASPR